MKPRRFSVIRPQVEIEVSTSVRWTDWLRFPFAIARVYGVGIRLFTFNLLAGNMKLGKMRVLTIPHLTIKRADAP